MTNKEFIEVAESELNGNGKITNVIRKRFLKRLKEDPRFCEETQIAFGDKGLYYSNVGELNKFIVDIEKKI